MNQKHKNKTCMSWKKKWRLQFGRANIAAKMKRPTARYEPLRFLQQKEKP